MSQFSTFSKIGVVGFGNVAYHFAKILLEKNSLKTLCVRNAVEKQISHPEFSSFFEEKYEALESCDLVLVCVKDDAMASVIKKIPASCAVASVSGSVQLVSLPKRERLGVLYPLQSFTKTSPLDWTLLPLFIESENEKMARELFQFAAELSKQVHFADSDLRKKMHLAAVFVNNFVNQQIYIAEQLAIKYDFDIEFLYPLLSETISKAIVNGAFESQTGPALRSDFEVINEHEKLLPKEFKKVYQVLTQSIIKSHEII